MKATIPDPFIASLLRDGGSGQIPTSGTVDDNDDRDDEHEGENSASVRMLNENTEAPEEFGGDDGDESSARELARTRKVETSGD